MKMITTFVVIVLMSLGFVQMVYAQGGGKGGVGNSSSGTVQADQIREQDRDRVQDPTTHDGDEPEQDRDQTRDRDRLQTSTTTSVPVRATNSFMLRETIEEKERELNQVMASSAPRAQNMVQNENRVRLAVHALLASEDLLGGIGPQVREIARNINNSLATTSNAEKNISSRGFWAKLFFGGDKNNAKLIEREIIQNQNRIEELQRLLTMTNSISSPVREMLEEQVRALQEEQERLRVLAEQEKEDSGIFSWRF